MLSIALACIGLLGLFAYIGARSQRIFRAPEKLSDSQLEATVTLTSRIMEMTRPGAPTWARAAAKYQAAINEQLRRQGKAPLDEIEIEGLIR
ncbi:MAG TPA: hypothetical protein VI381_02860 [Allosphingosinicella sp.]